MARARSYEGGSGRDEKGNENGNGKESARMRKKGKGKADEPGGRRKTGMSESGFRLGFIPKRRRRTDGGGGGGGERKVHMRRQAREEEAQSSVRHSISPCENVGNLDEDVDGGERAQTRIRWAYEEIKQVGQSGGSRSAGRGTYII